MRILESVTEDEVVECFVQAELHSQRYGAIVAGLLAEDGIAVRELAGPLVLLEGHVRLPAYALFPDYLPEELEIYVGESPNMSRWSEY